MEASAAPFLMGGILIFFLGCPRKGWLAGFYGVSRLPAVSRRWGQVIITSEGSIRINIVQSNNISIASGGCFGCGDVAFNFQ